MKGWNSPGENRGGVQTQLYFATPATASLNKGPSLKRIASKTSLKGMARRNPQGMRRNPSCLRVFDNLFFLFFFFYQRETLKIFEILIGILISIRIFLPPKIESSWKFGANRFLRLVLEELKMVKIKSLLT